ncbi:MAG: adenylate/guanylate cyclase domain-containing protein [Cyclobacteriaceae bacterium]
MLDPFLNTEMIKSEKKRLEVFMGVLLSGLTITIVVRLFQLEELKITFENDRSYFTLMAAIALMNGFIFLSRSWVTRVLRSGGRLTKRYFWLTTGMEVLIPSLWLVVVALEEQSAYFLDSPAIFMYFVLIIVSSMHLSFWISAVMGLLIGGFYAGYTYWVTTSYSMIYNLPIFIFYVRAAVYVIAGICAGLVAMELRNRLSATHQHMLEKEEIEGLFSQQISPQLVKVLKEKKDYTARLEAVLVFLDIRDFTEKVQHLSPEEVNEFQNRFFSPIIQIINDNKGLVNQIMGDGLMATFGVPKIDNLHHQYAWKAVESILKFIKQFRKEHKEHQLLDVGIGMHIGEVLVGNIGTDTRKQLSISGKAVIVASRIEQFNKELNSTLLMSGELYHLLAGEIGNYKSKSSYKLKGIDEEITIVQII